MSETLEAAPAPAPEEWAIVEIMGHLRRAGRISEVARFGAALLRVDIPIESETEGETIWATEYFSGGSIYRLRPCTEEIARAAALSIGDPRPAAPISYRARLPAPDPALDDDYGENPFGLDMDGFE